ncbi:MAG: DNA polymerase III subunit delta [Parcubacteria group bacterium]
MFYVPCFMIIFLCGEDFFRSGEKVAEIKKKFLEKDPIGSGLSVFDFSDSKIETDSVLGALSTSNLLAPKRLVIIKNIISEGTERAREDMLMFLKKQKWFAEDQDTVAVFWEAGKVKKSDLLHKYFLKNAKNQEFEKLIGAKLSQWVLLRIKKIDEKNSISLTALEKLLAFAGEDMHLLNNEIEKLSAYAGGKTITEEDVELLVRANLGSNIFNTIDAIGANNKKEALALLHRHLEKGEDPFYLLSMFVYQFRNLLKVADFKNQFGADEYAISRESKMHPFVVKKSLAQIRNFSFDKLKNIYQKLGELDTAVKTGKVEIKMGLDKFIVEL